MSGETKFKQKVWRCETPDGVAYIHVETERWFDARAFAIRVMGCVDATVKEVADDENPFPRTQVRWIGTAASFTTNPLRQEMRDVRSPRSQASWRPVG